MFYETASLKKPTGKEKGEKLGLEKGEKIGLEKGEKIGIEKERAKAHQEKIEMAKKMNVISKSVIL